ncbi:Bifunctional inhibitor/lipid-transfer protein/seed storage 2S albumin superfamily protein [Striga hermonthica]|uniref:Bifunctional inhibitor/lipid-transfer protein/seed storage 2S albumin superfamily protein n=1 Tax=Striga hermonthica TaxID=68872 RepID=A0A9N7R1P5_STRHE|nr:Bifunctional inhibitor/lipid-transfer protein/seed storage 2S albumin superfamily protein [Striga hermonthica]
MGGATAAKFLFLVLALMAAFLGRAAAFSVCNVTEEGLEACKPSVTQPSPVPPSTECCHAVSGADLKCLCSYRNSFMLPALGIDPDLALALPAKCNLPPPADC